MKRKTSPGEVQKSDGELNNDILGGNSSSGSSDEDVLVDDMQLVAEFAAAEVAAEQATLTTAKPSRSTLALHGNLAAIEIEMLAVTGEVRPAFLVNTGTMAGAVDHDSAQDIVVSGSERQVISSYDIDAAAKNATTNLDSDSDSDSDSDESLASAGDRRRGTSKPSSDVAALADEEEEGIAGPAPTRTKNEVPLSALPVPIVGSLIAGAELSIAPVGAIYSVLPGVGWDDANDERSGGGNSVARKSKGGKQREETAAPSPTTVAVIIQSHRDGHPLDENSVLCLGDRRVLGRIEEVFGPVAAPLYLVRVQVLPEAISRSENDAVLQREYQKAGLGAVAQAAHAGELPPPMTRSGCDRGTEPSALQILAADYADDDASDAEPTKEHSALVKGRDAGDQSLCATAALSAEAAADAVQLSLTTLIRVDDLATGVPVMAVTGLSHFIFPDAVRRACGAGSDASNLWDEEIGAGATM